MGLFGWLKPEDEEEDRSLIEISNDSGDHYVADIPTQGVRETEKALRDAGVDRDDDERLVNTYQPKRIVDSRDSKQHRYRSERVVDKGEDLEDSYDREDVSDLEDDPSDREDDTSDFEESEQPATWRWW